MKELQSAVRQYQHNDCSGLVMGYDREETERVVSELLRERNELAAHVERLRGVLDGIANPVGRLVKEAEEAGADIDGAYAVQLAKDAEILKGWACSALSETPSQSLEAVKRECNQEFVGDALDELPWYYNREFLRIDDLIKFAGIDS